MKVNWGWGIAIFYTTFVLVFIVAVYASTFVKPDLVSDDYYRDEQAYQQIINKKNNTNQLTIQPTAKVIDSKILITFPIEQNTAKGNIILFRPSDASKDFSLPLNLNKLSMQEIDVSNHAKGKWIVKIDWEYLNEKYYWEYEVAF